MTAPERLSDERIEELMHGNLFSDEMDSAANAFHSTQYGIRKNAENAGEKVDGERLVRTCIAAAIDAYLNQTAPTAPEPSAPDNMAEDRRRMKQNGPSFIANTINAIEGAPTPTDLTAEVVKAARTRAVYADEHSFTCNKNVYPDEITECCCGYEALAKALSALDAAGGGG